MSAAPKLTVLKDGDQIKEIELNHEVSVGRDENCVIRLADRLVSRNHAVFRPSDKGVEVQKKSQFAPLKVNGEECTSALLREGDVVAIGPYLVKVSERAAVKAEQLKAEASPIHQLKDEIAAVPNENANGDISALLEIPGEVASGDAPASSNDLVAESDQEDSLDLDENGVAKLESWEDSVNGGPAQKDGEGPDKIDFDFQDGEINGSPQSAPSSDLSKANAPEKVDQDYPEDAQTKAASLRQFKVTLKFENGGAEQSVYEFSQDEILIGRSQKCDVIITDKKASRRHTLIRKVGSSFLVKDLNSANGTMVNGALIDEQSLSGDDILKIGDSEFSFQLVSVDFERKAAQAVPIPQEVSRVLEGISQDPNLMQSLDNPGAMAIPGEEGLESAESGIAGISEGAPQSLLEKYKKLPKVRKILVILAIGALLLWMIPDEEFELAPEKPTQTKKKNETKGEKKIRFEDLSQKDKQYVIQQRQLAFDLYKDGKYDEALDAIRSIFKLGLENYDDAREIERYALEGKRRVEQERDEHEKKEREEKIRVRVEELLKQAETFMAKKNYVAARAIFGEISVLDPENAQVQTWENQIRETEDAKKQAETEKKLRDSLNESAWKIYKEADQLKGEGKYLEAIRRFKEVAAVNAPDPKIVPEAQARIQESYEAIQAQVEPLLQEAKQYEESGEMVQAFKIYEKISQINPEGKEGFQGMARIRQTLHDKAKVLYTEAVLAENYSDFVLAKKKFEEILQVAPKDDLYHDRAQRKLARYVGLPSEQDEQQGYEEQGGEGF